MKRRQIERSQGLPRLLLIGMPLVFLLSVLTSPDRASADSCVNVAGTWHVHSLVDASECGESQYHQDATFTVTQNGCDISVANAFMAYHGMVTGNQVQLNTSYPEDGGITNERVTLTIDGNALYGAAFWTWTDSSYTCSGTTQISGTLENGPAPPEGATLEGIVKDASTGKPVEQALLTLFPGGYEAGSGPDGSFTVSGLPPGMYTVQVSASGYLSKPFQAVTVLASVSNQLNVSLVPYSPQVLGASASPSKVGNDGQGKTLLSLHVTHPSGLSAILSVFGDLTQIGGSAQQSFYDDGNHGDGDAGDGTYACQVTVAKGIKARLYTLNVTAVDRTGGKGLGSIPLDITDKLSGTIGPVQANLKIFDNALRGQDLNIHFSFLKAVSGLRSIKAECQVEVTIYDPNHVKYDTYHGTDEIDINIPNAAEGEWDYEIFSQCDSVLYYEVETNGSGTGVLAGRVVDGFSGAGLAGANIKWNTGGTTVSLDQGYYSGVAVAGTGQVITDKAGYQTNIKNGVHVNAGATTNLNIQIVPQDISAQAPPSGQNVYSILDPSEDPNPPSQPFAAKVSGSNLEFNVLFPRYQQAVDLYLGMTINTPQHAGKLYLLDQSDVWVQFTDTLRAWRKGTTKGEAAQVLISAISGTYPFGDYTLYALVTTDSATFSDYDLSYFTTTLAQPPPNGQNVIYLSDPLDDPNPVTQHLAAKVTGGNLVLNALFPPQAEPVTIFLAYSTPSGALFLFKQDDSQELFNGTLRPWRQNLTAELARQVLSMPTVQMSQGVYYFYALVTTDPSALSNFDLTYFALNIRY